MTRLHSRPVGQRLRDLLSDHRATVAAAIASFNRLAMGAGFDCSDLPHDRLLARDEVVGAIRSRAAEASFPLTAVTRQVFAMWDAYQALHEAAMEQWRQQNDRVESLMDRATQRLQQRGADDRRKLGRLMRIACAASAQGVDMTPLETLVVVTMLLEALGPLLPPELDPHIRRILEDEQRGGQLVEHLRGDVVLRHVRAIVARCQVEGGFRHAAIGALASLGADHPQVVPLAERWCRADNLWDRYAAARLIEPIGPRFADAAPEAAAHVAAEAAKPHPPHGTIHLWSRLLPPGADPEPLLRLLDHPDGEVQGEAIEALGHLRCEQAAVALARCLVDFRETDPDRGPYQRVCEALAALGPGAALAVPAVAEALQASAESESGTEPGEPPYVQLDDDLLDVLAAVGPVACDALPVLQPLLEIEQRYAAWEASFEERADDDDFDDEEETVLDLSPAADTFECDVRLEAFLRRLSPDVDERSPLRRAIDAIQS